MESDEPTRDEIDHMSGPVLLEFGAEWCGYCNQLRPHVAALLTLHPQVKHIRIEDGPGLPLGRSFGVKLWPTFVFMRDGKELRKAVRPPIAEVRAGLDAIAEDV